MQLEPVLNETKAKGIGHKIYCDKYIVFDNGEVYLSKDGSVRKCNQTRRPDGYCSISINGRAKLLHRIIAECFLENPMNLSTVNHKNGKKDDNRTENLEWCSNERNVSLMNASHSQRYLTVMKAERVKRGVTRDNIKGWIKENTQGTIMIGRIRDIENGISAPTDSETELIEQYFKIPIGILLSESKQ